MPTVRTAASGVSSPAGLYETVESPISAVSWAAIIGGAFAAASIAIILLALGSGLGFASISPWPNSGASAITFSIAAGIWLIVVEWISSGLGGYVTGRLRTKWVGLHTHEVFFRDTAHGFLTWAVASVIGGLILASAVSSTVGTATRAVASVASSAQSTGGLSPVAQTRAYDVDSLFRGENAAMVTTDPQVRAEVSGILAHDMLTGQVPSSDRDYLVQLVAQRTGLSQADAEKRVDGVIAQEKATETKARQVADAARKSASAVGIFAALSMLIGAFIASVAAAYGGSQRDEHV